MTLAQAQRTPTTARDEAAPDERADEPGSTTHFVAGGALPPVSTTEAEPKPSASDLAYGSDSNQHLQHELAAHERAAETFDREPLNDLKTLAAHVNVDRFLALMHHAPIRKGTGGIRTPISPQDGLAVIITAFVLRVVDKYTTATENKRARDEHDPRARAKDDHVLAELKRIMADHLRLLMLQNHGESGGHRVAGIDHGDHAHHAVAGPTRSHGRTLGTPVIAVNQTAVTLVSLQRLYDNSRVQDERGQLGAQIANLAPELLKELEHCYGGSNRANWLYGSSDRREDDSHLKTTYTQLVDLAALAHQSHESPLAKYAKQFHHQADRLDKLAGHIVHAPWDQLSNQPPIAA